MINCVTPLNEDSLSILLMVPLGAAMSKAYEEHIQWDTALDRRFVKIFLQPLKTQGL